MDGKRQIFVGRKLLQVLCWCVLVAQKMSPRSCFMRLFFLTPVGSAPPNAKWSVKFITTMGNWTGRSRDVLFINGWFRSPRSSWVQRLQAALCPSQFTDVLELQTSCFEDVWKKLKERAKWDTLPETNIAPKNRWLEYYFPIGEAFFQGLC